MSTTEPPLSIDDLRVVPLFARLEDADLAELARRCAVRPLEKGEVLWSAGDAGDELVVVLSGELEVHGADGSGGEELIARLGPGEHAGELALLLGERRSATVVCSVPGTVLAVDADTFDAVVHDRALAVLSEVVARRAVERVRRRPVSDRLRVVGVVAEPGGRGASTIAAAIAALTPALLPKQAVLADGDDIAGLRSRHADLDLCVVDLGTMSVAEAQARCDVVVRVSADASTSPLPGVLTVVIGAGAPAYAASCDPFLVPDVPALHGLQPAAAVAVLLGDARHAARPPLDRLVRKLFGVTVGLALGGGAAFGIAHIGVLQALEHAGVPVDLFAGTSFGSIVAIGAAAGLSGDELAAIATRIGTLRTTLSVLDPAVDGSGLLAGRRLVKIFSPLVPCDRFEELTRPCRVVATDIESGDRVDIGTGRLDDAFRASCSIPLVFSPVISGGRTLVDGAMVDPVPAEVVRQMGADIVVAVNVVPRLDKGSTTAISRLFKTVSRFNPLSYRSGARGLPDVVDVLMNSLQVVQYELGRFRSLAADVPIEVDLAGFTWIDFTKAGAITARGLDAGEAAVPLVQAALSERLSSVR